MNTDEILRSVDHTLLKPESTWEEIRRLCDEGVKYRTASVCIPPSYVKRAAEYLAGKLPVCTVIGFPCGYQTTGVKAFEAADAVANGADEIDMVINLGWLRDREYDLILDEIKQVRRACPGKVLKVIIETCLLSDDEKIKMCGIVSQSGADFIKTSTGFSTGGAVSADVALLRKNVAPAVQVKAAGGISSLADAQEFMELGASRLGTSRVVKIISKED